MNLNWSDLSCLKTFARLPKAKPHSQGIQFFVVGTGRCGTTLVRNGLNLHPDVFVPSESHWIPVQYEFCGTGRHPISVHTEIVERFSFHTSELTIDAMAREIGVSRSYLFAALNEKVSGQDVTVSEFNNSLYETIGQLKESLVFGDKTADYCAYMPVLQTLWPDAKFVHIVRDGRDVALSMSQHPGFQLMISLKIPNWVPLAFDRRYKFLQKPRKEELDDYVRLWEFRIKRTIADAERLRPSSYLCIRYEDILRNTRATMGCLARFLGIEAHDRWLSAMQRLVIPDNIDKVGDRVLWDRLTMSVQKTLESLGYRTTW